MRRAVPLLALILLSLAPVALGQEATPPAAAAAAKKLVVGVTDSPPLSYRTDDGIWTGLAVVLWEEVAAQMGFQYEYRPLEFSDVDVVLTNGTVDAVLGGAPVTLEGEAIHDFTQPYLVTGLGFAQRQRGAVQWSAILGALFDPRLLTIVGLIIVGVLTVGVVIALVERRERITDFGGSMRESVSTGVWWAAVTMTTVGYGDATPKTTTGRALALLWMFVGVVAVAFLTATVTSVLTVTHLRGAVQQPSDLFRLRLATVEGGAGADYLHNRHVSFAMFPTYEEALTQLDAGNIDAVVANIPVLRSLVSHEWVGRLQVSPIALEPLLFAVAIPENSPLEPDQPGAPQHHARRQVARHRGTLPRPPVVPRRHRRHRRLAEPLQGSGRERGRLARISSATGPRHATQLRRRRMQGPHGPCPPRAVARVTRPRRRARWGARHADPRPHTAPVGDRRSGNAYRPRTGT
jgi:ABC-type amino acid transport substrate-binding protein